VLLDVTAEGINAREKPGVDSAAVAGMTMIAHRVISFPRQYAEQPSQAGMC